MKKLDLILLFRHLKNNYHIILFVIILFLIVYKTFNLIVILVFVGYLIYLLKKAPKIALFSILIIIIIIVRIIVNKIIVISFESNNEYSGYLKVEKIKKTTDKYQVVLKNKLGKYVAYIDEEIGLGDIYYIEGMIQNPSHEHFEGGFNYKEYLMNQGIYGIIEIENIEFYQNSFSVYYLNHKINEYIDNILSTSSKGMIKALTIGNKDDFEDTLLNNISSIGVSHLFVISGLHVNLIIAFINFILKRVKLKEKIKTLLTIITLILYYIICGYMISIFRVICSYILRNINENKKWKLSSLDIISINILIVTIFNYRIVFTYSFILSYLISFGIILISKILTQSNKIYDSLINNIKISLLSIFITLPVIININHDVNFISVLYNLVYIPFVSYIMLPFSAICILIPQLEPIYYYIYLGFEFITEVLSNIDILTFVFPNVNFVIILVYYFLLYNLLLYLEQKKTVRLILFLFLMLLTIWSNINIFNIYDEVYFLDLPKGEATFIREKFNRANILIDTGENGYDDIIQFLKSKGIKRIDAIIISHSDSDHIGMIEEICDKFKVKSIYYGIYDINATKYIPNNIPKVKLKKGDTLRIGSSYFEVISPTKNYYDTNNNSIVLYSKIFNLTYLFTGDIEKKVEDDILDKIDVDILKVAHHGSNTSTSNNFLDRINFKYAICMNGYRNQFSFPSINVKNKINDKLLITSELNTIVIRKNQIIHNN